MHRQQATTLTTTRVAQRREQVWTLAFRRSLRVRDRWYAEVERLDAAGIAVDTPEYRRALYMRQQAEYAYEAATEW